MKSHWFDDIPIIGQLPEDEKRDWIHQVFGDEYQIEPSDDSTKLSRDNACGFSYAVPAEGETEKKKKSKLLNLIFDSKPKPWEHTAHLFGFIPKGVTRGEQIPIEHAGNIDPDPSLRDARIKITLDMLRIASYPGKGIHRVLFDFYAQNQASKGIEHLHFNATYRVQEGQRAAALGFPIFTGLRVGSEGVTFKCFTVNVKNDEDETVLDALESDVFKTGLRLTKAAQPAIAPLCGMAMAMTRSIAKRHRNIPVQDIFLGLDFSNIATRAKLREGSYVAVQVPEANSVLESWSDWVFNRDQGLITLRHDGLTILPYNFLIISVSRMA